MEDVGKVVAEYHFPVGNVQICDGYISKRTPEQRAADIREAQRVAWEIAFRAMVRGEVQGLTPEEWKAWAATRKQKNR